MNEAVNALKTGSPDAIDKVLGFQVDKNHRKHVDKFIKEVRTVTVFCLNYYNYQYFFV